MTKATDLFQLFDVLIQLKVVENDGHEEWDDNLKSVTSRGERLTKYKHQQFHTL
jgi:hypothetical protein